MTQKPALTCAVKLCSVPEDKDGLSDVFSHHKVVSVKQFKKKTPKQILTAVTTIL